jgi:pimeloyl-ACP methyl ester carboxylesterase
MPLTTRLLAATAAGLAMAGAIIAPGPAGAAQPAAARSTATRQPAARPAAGESDAARSATGESEAAWSEAAWSEAAWSAAGKWDRTGAVERRRVDAVATPKLRWYSCYGWGQCATARVPLDYDRPHGTQVTLALLRVRARDQKHRLGSLFVNPGGPGGSAVTMALAAPYFMSSAILDRFDIVGMDPRGIGFSDQVNCFGDARRQAPTMRRLSIGFPWGAAQERTFLTAAGKAARACSTAGREMAGAMSTAEVVRDMELMRRAVGDQKLTYLGFSYGTAIGQYYANMFPDRVRAIAVDGVVYPRAWVGSRRTAGQIQDDRLRSADGAWKAFLELMRRCAKAGPAKCRFSDHPVQRFAVLADRLKKKPVVAQGEKVTYALFVSMVLGALYAPDAGDEITSLAAALYLLSTAGHVPTQSELSDVKDMVVHLRRQAEGRAFPYDNSFDAYASVMCTDGRHPAHGTAWPTAAARADRRAPYFGRAWAWASAQCARDRWTVRDEDAYTGPFNHRTRYPVLVVGSYWDPATNYADAVKSSRLLPNSRLLSSNNWGHTAYGTSPCATGTVDRYLINRVLPARGATCVGSQQPFRTPLSDDETSAQAAGAFDLAAASITEIAAHGLPAPDAPKALPPVR